MQRQFVYKCIFLLTLVSVSLVCIIIRSPYFSDNKRKPYLSFSSPLDKEQLAKELLVIIQRLDSSSHDNELKEVQEQLKEMVVMLKSSLKVKTFDENKNDFQATENSTVKIENNVHDDKKSNVEVCPERYIHSNLSYPYFMNGSWVKESGCGNEKPIRELVTVALILAPMKGFPCTNKTKSIVQSVQSLHSGTRIVIGSAYGSCEEIRLKNVKIVQINKKESAGRAWNMIMNFVTTPYVLIARHLDDFNHFLKMKRQILLMSVNERIKIAGGSFRNRSGHWQVGCYQSETRFYQLKYIDGYHFSQNECMFCDHLLGPFIAKTSLFKSVSFDSFLPESVLFEDFFLRVKLKGFKVVNCPDSMFFATDPYLDGKTKYRKTWLAFVRKWKFNELYLPDGIRHRFSCTESGCTCRHLLSSSKTRSMPLCCMDQLENALKKFHKLMVANNFSYFVNGGTLLGAVKFRDVVPWDFDGDIVYYYSNSSFFKNRKRTNKMSSFFDDFDKKTPGYFQIKSPDIPIEVMPFNKTAIDVSGMREFFFKTPTLVRIRGTWVCGPPNPGVYLRNMYGKEYLKHSNGWWQKGHLWYDPYISQKHFFKCDKPKHHSCTDQFPTDGSLAFTFH